MLRDAANLLLALLIGLVGGALCGAIILPVSACNTTLQMGRTSKSSFVAEGHHRVDFYRAMRGDKAGQERDEDQCDRNQHIG